MISFARRSFVLGGVTAAAALASFGTGRTKRKSITPWGPLQPDPAGLLDLPPGFSYRLLQGSGDTMSDGYRVPANPDGMAAFPGPNGKIVLMRNHENTEFGGPWFPEQNPPPQTYDPEAAGGVTRVVLGSDQSVLSSNLVLAGTIRNCAGGLSPWGWLSCEETTEPGHGYVFLCPLNAQTVQYPFKIPAYGRFRHEAACVDPSTGACYLTEDEGDGCLYRFMPDDPSAPFVGQLQALRVRGADGFATTGMNVRQAVSIEWVDVDDPEGSSTSCRYQGLGQGAAVIIRGEGIWFDRGAIYVCSTSGGPVGGGQIFRLVDHPREGTLQLMAQSTDPAVLDMPDNITVAPWGDVVMAEDGFSTPHIRLLTPRGDIYDFARNAANGSEFCGVCFAPDGRSLFLNVYSGWTFVINGPFPGGGAGRPPEPEPEDPTDSSLQPDDPEGCGF